MKTLLKNGTLIDYKTNTFEVLDILIENDKIKKISKEISEEEKIILEKIKKSGYESLTNEEKRKLFDASNR